MASSDSKYEHGSTNSQTFVNLVRCLMGMGTLTLPKAVARAGILPLCLALSILPFLSFTTAMWAIGLKRKSAGSSAESAEETDPLWKAESATGSGSTSMSDDDDDDDELQAALQSSLSGFDLVVRDTLGVLGRAFFVTAIMSSHFFGGVAYINAVEEGMQALFPGVSQNLGLIVTCLALMTLTLLAPNLRDIAFLSLASTLVLLYIFVSIPIEGLRNATFSAAGRLPFWNGSANLLDYGYTCGAVSFTFCEFMVNLCLYEDMKHKEDFPLVAGAAYTVSAVAGIVWGVVGYWAFGAEVKELVYLNFPPGSVSGSICIMAYSFILIGSYLVSLTPVFLFARHLLPSIPYSIIRCGFIVLSIISSKLMPSVMMVTLLMTCFCTMTTDMIIPAICYLRKGDRYAFGQRCLAFLCIATGTFVFIDGTLVALLTPV